jgi:hypothetical protein
MLIDAPPVRMQWTGGANGGCQIGEFWELSHPGVCSVCRLAGRVVGIGWRVRANSMNSGN